MIDRGGSEKKTPIKKTPISQTFNGGTFLGSRPGTITKQAKIPANSSDIVKSIPDLINKGFEKAAEWDKRSREKHPIVPLKDRINNAVRPNYSGYTGGQFSLVNVGVNAWRKQMEPKNMSDYARYAAKRDTATNAEDQRFYNGYTINQDVHNEAIALGQEWMTDSQKYTDWILSADDDQAANERIEIGEKYFEEALHEVPTYDPTTHTYSTQMQFKEGAALPPWIEPTQYNIMLWDYYTTYAHDVVQSAANAYIEARDLGREYARNPYKSAFSESENTGAINSFLDVVISSVDKDGFDATYDKLLPNTINYFRDYVWNPIKTGHLKTAAGNALWNLMDTMDVASRGVRAFVAGDTALGGTGERRFETLNSSLDDYYTKTWEKYGVRPSAEYERNKYHGKWTRLNDAKFKGQKVYWANIPDHIDEDGNPDEELMRAQQLFMDNGGYDLLLSKHPEFANMKKLGSGDISISDSDRTQMYKHLDEIFADSDIDWHDIYRDIDKNFFTKDASVKAASQGWENVKQAYSDVDANYYADTGNLAADIIIETALDPGLIVGGISKSATKEGVKSAAETAVREGFWNASKHMDDVDSAMKNKDVQMALRKLISSNEGRNIIFKNADNFDEDVKLFINKISKHTDFLKNEEAQKIFRDTITAHLMGKQRSINGMIIEAQNFARNGLDSKAFKAASFMDKAIDSADSLIIKSSFFLPWAGVKGVKALGNGILNSKTLGRAMARINLRRQNALRTIIDEVTNKTDVTKVSRLMDEFEAGLHNEDSVRFALRNIIDQYDEVTWGMNDIIRRFSKGEITDEEAFRLIGDAIHEMTGGKYRYVQELAGYVDSIAVKYAGDIKSAYGRLDDTFRRLQNLVDRRSENAVESFIDEVRRVNNKDDLKILFREHMDNEYIMALRHQIIDNTQFDITEKELDDLINEIRTGLFSDEGIDRSIIEKGVAAQAKLSDKTIRRTLSFKQFDEILGNMGIDWQQVLAAEGAEDVAYGTFETKLASFMSEWSKQPYVTYNIDDALGFVDRMERQIHVKEIMNLGSYFPEYSALSAHKMVGQFNALRKQIKKLDLINLKDVKVITIPQMDRMAMNLEFRNNADIQALYGDFYNDVIDPIWKYFRDAMTDQVDLMDSSLFKDVDDIARQKYGFDRTSQLIEEAKTLPGFSDEHLHSFMNTLATDFRFRDDMGNIDLAPGQLRRKVEATLRAQTGGSKVGMKNITDSLQSLNSNNPSGFLKNYAKEFEANPELLERYNRYIETDVLDPRAYVEKQMLYTVLADPTVIPEWNALAKKGQAPIAFHINTTGLNNEINSMTSISFRKWVPIELADDEALTLEKVLDSLDAGETTIFQRHMSDNEFNELTEQVIRNFDMKDCDPSRVMERYKSFYGVSETAAYKSESEMIEEACAYLNDATILKESEEGLRSVSPTLLVHDLDGFNVDYFNNKISAMANSLDENSKTYDYLHRVSGSAKVNSCNTYTRLAQMAGDIYYTEEQLELITDMLHDYIDDINHFANGYRFNDMHTYSRKLHKVIDELSLKKEAKTITTKEKEFLSLFEASNGSAMLSSYDLAVKNIADLGLYPRQFAFTSSGLEDNMTKAALEATGRTSVNVNTRIIVDDVLSYFDLATDEGFYAPIEDLRKMHEVSQYIINTRNKQIVAGAEEFLKPYKSDLDRVIQSVIDLSYKSSYEATKLAYLQHMKIPDNAIDSYLMAKKLYTDHLKYWLDTDEVTSLRTGGKELDAMRYKLGGAGRALGWQNPRVKLQQHMVFNEACDYINNNRVRFFDELVGGGFSLERLEKVNSWDFELEKFHQSYWDDVSKEASKIWDDFRASKIPSYKEAVDRSDKYYTQAIEDYEAASLKKQSELLNDILESNESIYNSERVLDLLQGAHEPEIYNWAARSDFEKRVLTYKDGVMKSGLDKATKYTEASSRIKSDMRQLQHMDDYFASVGLVKRQDRMTASLYAKTNQLFDILEDTGLLKRDSFHTFMEKATQVQRLQLQQYRLDALKNADGAFDRTKLLSDLVYNGFNMSVFNAHNYSVKEMNDLRSFVKELQRNGDDFLSYYEDRTTGNIFVYFNNNCTIAEADGGRWINNRFKFERPVHEAVLYADFDELAEVLNLEDIEDFRGVYEHLQSCWEDTQLLSFGQINGTTGRTVSRSQAESFLQTLPSNMEDWLSSEGLLYDELARGVIYDPGFVSNEPTDMLTDFLGTIQRQAETAKDDCILINEVFNSNSGVKFNELADNFTVEELIDYFGENPEYVVCTIRDNSTTATGLEVRQLNLKNAAGVEAAKNTPNTTILPYSVYYEISNYMNRDVTDNVYKKLLGKYMLVYKAFALAKPGTWMRNYIDATTKAAFDNKSGADNFLSMIQYEGRAAKDIGTYGRIMSNDPKLINPANWDLIQRVYKTDMTYEDFELLRGVMDSDRYKSADKYFLRKTADRRGGFNVISGQNIGLRNLDEKDIKVAFDKYLAIEPDLPLTKQQFMDVYIAKQAGSTNIDSVIDEQFEEMFRKLSNNLRSMNAMNVFDKTVDTMFKPFGTVEELVRYAQSLQLRDSGFSQNRITRHIHSTQFYNAPTWGTWRKLETIMPFITFKYNNLMYWVRMMDENPRLFRYFEDTYRSVYDTTLESALQEGVELDYEDDYGLQSGGIPLGNGKRYFNIGSSFLSAMNDFYGTPKDIDSLNPLIRDTVRTSMYALGLNSKEFFSDLDLDITDDNVVEQAKQLIPGYALAKKGTKLFRDIKDICTESGGPTMDVIYSTMNFLGVLGVRYQYRDKSGRFSMDEYQEELARQGKWYDANLGEVVDISYKNDYGANDPNASWKDVQTYMLVHFGKVWDANQRKFVTMDQYQEGGYNDGFDFDNDPEAWTKLCGYMKEAGKKWDYNQRKFVYTSDYISGGLNAEGLEWETKIALMEEKFPNLVWDANQNAFVEKRFYIHGGMNDFSQYSGDEFLQHWNELKSLRLALYGETYNSETHKFEATQDPMIVTMDSFMDKEDRKNYDNYYALLAIPRLWNSDKPFHVNSEGLLVTEDGKYLITGNAAYDAKVFDKFKGLISYGGRQYHGHKNYSFSRFGKFSDYDNFGRIQSVRKPKTRKPYFGRISGPKTYQSGYGWNEEYGYYREAFRFSYQYHNPQPAGKLNRLISPPTFYPYGGGYSKYSFHSRY